ncbi:ThiF family adenylyltransferase [Paenibacillus sp. Soil724D2]|uniref:ThiF family adenylyltransferase n=1 Tax=Paenibacillus sp. (strain Soil724D2) TaxID=1736392 RepID=UPI00071470C0|nr:ThiF family adenylyltransferase [Paenibacillus sp. Soil724D2]KRE48384.1 hypothetical protein ASG85_05115 [Paenibacillus sp. Soil724D2]
MEDLRNLEGYYEGVLQSAALYLTDNYQAVKVSPFGLDKELFPYTFKVKNHEQYEIILALPFNFPDDFPTVLVPEPHFSRLYPMPHLSKSKVLCTFDSNVAHPNMNNPEGVIDEVIRKAYLLINDGLLGENPDDYYDEFESYWEQEAERNILSLIHLTHEPKKIDLITFKHPNWEQTILAADSRNEGVKWLLQAGAKIEQGTKKALFIPLQSIGIPPFPKSNGELLKCLRKYSPNAVKPLLDFLNANGRPSTVIFSIPNGEGQIIGSWEHPKALKFKSSAFKGKGKVQKTLKGFRPGKENALLELQRDFKDLKVNKYHLTRVDRVRLFTRGGDGSISTSRRVGVIGCGSIGSHLARSLVDMGIHKLLLVDKEKLTFENIARHLCGAKEVGKYKVDAVSKMITSHLPHSEITINNNDVLKALCDYETLLNRCDFSIVAVGHLPTELRLDQLQKDGLIDKPLLYVWVEPYLAGAHAVYVDPQNEGSLRDLFDEHHRFIQSVLENPGQYSKREAGCQSSYVPYGVNEVKRFISDLTILIHEIESGRISENMLFTWLGDLKLQRSCGRKIAGRWAVAENYSVRRYPLSIFKGVEVRR